MVNMDIKHVPQDHTKGDFLVEQEGEAAGRLHYILFGSGRLVIQHTEVDRKLQGTGAGRQLVDAAVAYAREEGLKIVPVCPYAKAVLARNPDQYKDVLA